ncbi:MAG: hypothetical protein PWP70_259 [Moorella sp. (in: firmicutes)]|nr:hypothetical protein [Moorella sp. (in: firmicutes)]
MKMQVEAKGWWVQTEGDLVRSVSKLSEVL